MSAGGTANRIYKGIYMIGSINYGPLFDHKSGHIQRIKHGRKIKGSAADLVI